MRQSISLLLPLFFFRALVPFDVVDVTIPAALTPALGDTFRNTIEGTVRGKRRRFSSTLLPCLEDGHGAASDRMSSGPRTALFSIRLP